MSLSWSDAQPRTVHRLHAGELWALAVFMFVVGVAIGYIAFTTTPATIGSHAVPGNLTCEEDQAIHFNRNAGTVPYPLGCIDIDYRPMSAIITERS